MEGDWIVIAVAVMVLLNFLLNLTSVYLGRYKRELLYHFDEHLTHIVEHICPAYDEDGKIYILRDSDEGDNTSELAKKLAKDRANFEEWDNSGEEAQ